jgi:hypothetical protein
MIGSGTSKADPVKKKSLPVKKQSLIEMAREEDPFLGFKLYTKRRPLQKFSHQCIIYVLGIWMGPPEKIMTQSEPRSKSFEVPGSPPMKQLDLLTGQAKIERGVSYCSPKTSTTTASVAKLGDLQKPTSLGEGSKWSRVRNAFLSREESFVDEANSLASMSLPSSPIRNSAMFFNEDEVPTTKGTPRSTLKPNNGANFDSRPSNCYRCGFCPPGAASSFGLRGHRKTYQTILKLLADHALF